MPHASENEKWRARQRALAQFAAHAIRGNDVEDLLQRACEHVAEGLGLPIAKLVLTQEGTTDLLLAAQVGLPRELAEPGRTRIPGGRNSAIGYTLEVGQTVISDVPSEARFMPSHIVRQSGVRTSANVIIWVDDQPYGSLEADSVEPWEPSPHDIDFLQTYADLVSAGIGRMLSAKRLEALSREREVLLQEIFHRNKNMLANILAISRRTARHSENLQQFRESFEGRVHALSRAHDLLLNAPNTPALLRELIETEFRAKGITPDANFTIEGPDLVCSPRAIQALALLVFELATNALKYGALSKSARPDAGIRVTWSVEKTGDKTLVHFVWRECGIGPLAPLNRRGFGSELMERLVPGMLEGEARLTMHADGIEYDLTFSTLDEGASRFSIMGA